MSTEVAVAKTLDQEKIELIKQTVAKGATDLELELFLHACNRTGLDPLMKQLYAIKRWSQADGREVMSFQTGIDGLRLIADRTKLYAGSDDAIFSGVVKEDDFKASVTVWKLVNGERCPFTASARWPEYVQKKKDGTPTKFWMQMPFGQLGKCAESLALRKAFPMELSGLYSDEEMVHLDSEWKPQIRTGQEMLAEMDSKSEPPAPPVEAKGSVLEPPTEEILKEMKRDMEPPTGTDAQFHEFLEKFNLVEYIKAWSDLKNDSLEYQWTPEQSKMLNDRSGLALKRLKDGEKKKR